MIIREILLFIAGATAIMFIAAWTVKSEPVNYAIAEELCEVNNLKCHVTESTINMPENW